MLGLGVCAPPASAAPRGAYTPPPGSPERKALMDAMRAYTMKLLGGTIPGSKGTILFKTRSLKVHGGWAFASVDPGTTDNTFHGETLNLLLHRVQSRWRVIDAPSFDDASDGKVSDATIMRRFRAKYRQAPGDIF